jgi:hypothetical protein
MHLNELINSNVNIDAVDGMGYTALMWGNQI